MGKRAQRATGITVSALAVAMLISGLTPGGGSLNDFSISSDDGTIQEDAAPRAYNELTSTRGIGKPEAHSDSTMSSDPWETAARAPGRSVARDSHGSYYLADQLLLRTQKGVEPKAVISELPPGNLHIAASDGAHREYRVLLPEALSKTELQTVASGWEAHPSVESAKIIELAPLRDSDLIGDGSSA